MEIYSVFTITERNGKVHAGEAVEGFGQSAVRYIRGKYPRLTKFVLEGFEIEGEFKELDMRTHNYIR